MRKIIKVFLASSIVEFANERLAIENFIRNVSDKFEEQYDVKIQPLLCENFDDAYSKVRKQEEYNEKIRGSELCFFIFFTKAGEYTREEFEVARKRFEETGKPKIYTYFKVIKDEKAEQSIYDFMEELDKTLGHYYGTFEHIDTVKLRILLSLKLQEMDFVEIKAEDGNCVVDGRVVMPLTNISEFANNEIYRQLQAELAEVEEKYFRLKAEYVKGGCSDALYREYAEIATKRQNLLDAIEELQKNIFNMSLRLSRDSVRGEVTPRQREAYRLFEAGDIEGANAILDFAEIRNDYRRRKMILAEEQKKNARIYIRETKTKIGILQTMTGLSNRFEEIEELYEEIVPEALYYGVESETALDCVVFLAEQNKHTRALEIAVQLEELYESGEVEADDEKKADLLFATATVCMVLSSKKEEAEKNIGKAIAIYEKLASENPERFTADLAMSYNNAGNFYKNQGQPAKAEEYYLQAIAIREKLATENPERFNAYLAGSYNNAGIFYDDQGQPARAEKYYLQAIAIYEKLASENPERFNAYLANSYNNAGLFYKDQGQPAKAEEYYLQAIAIREKLASENPERFNADLADSYNNAGLFYKDQGQPARAEEYYLQAIAIREKLASENPERFNADLADSYINAGIFYDDQGQPAKAEEYYLQAIAIREKLASENPERFNADLAASYNNAGVFYKDHGQPAKAEEYYLQAIAIYEKLASENPERFNADLAMSYNNAGNFYYNHGQPEKAEKYYLQAIAIREKLASKNPERFNPNLAVSYFNFAIFSDDDSYFAKALELAKTRPDDPYCRQIIAALTK